MRTQFQKLEHFMEDAGAKVRILILDACRDNPLRASKGMTRGFAGWGAEELIHCLRGG